MLCKGVYIFNCVCVYEHFVLYVWCVDTRTDIVIIHNTLYNSVLAYQRSRHMMSHLLSEDLFLPYITHFLPKLKISLRNVGKQ